MSSENTEKRISDQDFLLLWNMKSESINNLNAAARFMQQAFEAIERDGTIHESLDGDQFMSYVKKLVKKTAQQIEHYEQKTNKKL